MRTDIPLQIAFGWSGADDAWLSRSIRFLTRPSWAPRPVAEFSHMFLVFVFGDGTAVIHEALNDRGWSEQPAMKLDDWLRADPKRHHAELQWLDIPDEVIAEIWTESVTWLGTRSYAWQQLVIFGLAETYLGRGLRCLFPRALAIDVADDRVICSEGACQLVGSRWPALDLRRRGEPWAAISPQMARDRCRELQELLRPPVPGA